MSFRSMKAYTIYCSTGCSCCQGENHYRGPFESREEAEKAVEHYRSLPLVSSQYSATGNYRIYEDDAEQLPDGRIIISSRVFPGFVADLMGDSWESW